MGKSVPTFRLDMRADSVPRRRFPMNRYITKIYIPELYGKVYPEFDSKCARNRSSGPMLRAEQADAYASPEAPRACPRSSGCQQQLQHRNVNRAPPHAPVEAGVAIGDEPARAVQMPRSSTSRQQTRLQRQQVCEYGRCAIMAAGPPRGTTRSRRLRARRDTGTQRLCRRRCVWNWCS